MVSESSNLPSEEVSTVNPEETAGESIEDLETVESMDRILGDVPTGENPNAPWGTTEEPQGYSLVTGEMQVEGEEKKLTYVDYLKSPIINIQIGTEDGGSIISAHLLLLQRSPWFTEACINFDDSTPIAERVVSLPGEDFQTVGAFLEYLYTLEYTPRLVAGASGKPEDLVLEDSGDVDVDEDGDHLLKHAKVYTLAEKLRLPELKELAHSKIHRINSTAKGELRYAKFVYENTTQEDKTIRQPIASFWAHRSHVLRHEAEEEFKDMALEFPQFAYDILSIVLDQKEKGKDKDKEPRSRPTDESTDMVISATKTPRTGRKRPRTSTAL